MSNEANINLTSIRKRTWERRLDECKRKHRPKLNDWSKDRFAFDNTVESNDGRLNDFLNIQMFPSQIKHILYPNETIPFGSDKTFNPKISLPENSNKCNELLTIDKISCRNLNENEFISQYEKSNIPVIISDIPDNELWDAEYLWSFKSKLFRKTLGNKLFKCGEDDDGYKIKAKLKYFLKYMKYNKDDSPLYVFDGSFDDDNDSKTLLNDFKVPSYFQDDLFSLVGEKRRPPYRWFLIGPARSGSCCHIDPLGTSAWNALVKGRKRWVLFPPGTPKYIAKGLNIIIGEDDEAVNYFVDILPRIHREYGNIVRILEFTQEAGDTVFIPGGWWHSVLNLEDTIAVTQNFCSHANFDEVWRKTRIGRKKMSQKWLKQLAIHYPNLHSRALELNKVDNFVMNAIKNKCQPQSENCKDKEGTDVDSGNETTKEK